MKKSFIIFSQLREADKNSEFKIPLSPPQKPAGRAIELKSPCSNCGGMTGKFGAGRKPGEVSISCGACKKFFRWIGAAELKVLIKGGEE